MRDEVGYAWHFHYDFNADHVTGSMDTCVCACSSLEVTLRATLSGQRDW